MFVDVLRNSKNKRKKEKYPGSRNGHGKLRVSTALIIMNNDNCLFHRQRQQRRSEKRIINNIIVHTCIKVKTEQ